MGLIPTSSPQKRPGAPLDGSDSGDAAASPRPHRHAYGSSDGGDASSNASESSQVLCSPRPIWRWRLQQQACCRYPQPPCGDTASDCAG